MTLSHNPEVIINLASFEVTSQNCKVATISDLMLVILPTSSAKILIQSDFLPPALLPGSTQNYVLGSDHSWGLWFTKEKYQPCGQKRWWDQTTQRTHFPPELPRARSHRAGRARDGAAALAPRSRLQHLPLGLHPPRDKKSPFSC